MEVWSPELGTNVRVRRTVFGPEFGFLWKLTTKTGNEVTVTKTHPMKIREKNGWKNVAAKDVKTGDITPVNEIENEFEKVEKNFILWEWVYNLELDLPADTPLCQRTIVSNGIHTLDLYAQSFN